MPRRLFSGCGALHVLCFLNAFLNECIPHTGARRYAFLPVLYRDGVKSIARAHSPVTMVTARKLLA